MPSFKITGLLVLEMKILKIFTIYGHGGNLSHVTLTIYIYIYIYIYFRSPFQTRHHIKLGFDLPGGLSGKDV